MTLRNYGTGTALLVIGALLLEINFTNGNLNTTNGTQSNPLSSLILNQHQTENVNHNEDATENKLSRVRRQYGYDPYYYNRGYYPIPIFLGFGGYGFGGGFGGRGFAGRGFGGPGGFGGRGFGGGFGGRGFGGGFGGRGGGFGGGHGGGRG